jgi:hypothetical protein
LDQGHFSTVVIGITARPVAIDGCTQADPTKNLLASLACCMFAVDIILKNLLTVNAGSEFGCVYLLNSPIDTKLKYSIKRRFFQQILRDQTVLVPTSPVWSSDPAIQT